MKLATSLRGDQSHLDYTDIEDIVRSELFYRSVFNPQLFRQLEVARTNLDSDYFALLKASKFRNAKHIRPVFSRFKGQLERYLAKNCIELYGYLAILYKNSDDRKVLIGSQESAMIAVSHTLTNFLHEFTQPFVQFDDKFETKLRSSWVILKWRYAQESEILYPLYPELLVETTTSSSQS